MTYIKRPSWTFQGVPEGAGEGIVSSSQVGQSLKNNTCEIIYSVTHLGGQSLVG